MKFFDKENIIVIGIAAALLIAWGVWWYPKLQVQPRQNPTVRTEVKPAPQSAPIAQTQSQSVQKPAPVPAPQPAAPAPAVKIQEYPNVILSNEVMSAEINPNTGTIEKIELKKYDSSDRKGRIVYKTDQVPRKTFALDGLEEWQTVSLSTGQPQGSSNKLQLNRLLRKGRQQLSLTEIFILPEKSYNLKMKMTLSNPGKKAVTLPLFRIWLAGVPPMDYFGGDQLNGRNMHRIEYCSSGNRQMVSLDPAMKEEKFIALDLSNPADWVGVTNKYFASLLFSDSSFDAGVSVLRTPYQIPGKKAGSYYYVPSIGGNFRDLTLDPGTERAFSLQYYAGPKTMEEVRKLPESAMPILHISYFSWMEYLARLVLNILIFLKSICGNYGVAIILLTLIVRIVFFPLTERGNRSMRKMSKLAPKAKEIREKYKDNPQLMNQKTMELYRQEGVSPLGGCLPILLQIPVFFALYAALDSAVELRHVSFLWIHDLTKPDLVGPQFLFGYGIHPLVLAMTALMVLQQKMTPSNMDPAQQKMMLAMPIIMLLFLYNLPSGLTLYWTVSQIFSILQMKYSLYIAQREEEKKDPSQKQKSA